MLRRVRARFACSRSSRRSPDRCSGPRAQARCGIGVAVRAAMSACSARRDPRARGCRGWCGGRTAPRSHSTQMSRRRSSFGIGPICCDQPAAVRRLVAGRRLRSSGRRARRVARGRGRGGLLVRRASCSMSSSSCPSSRLSSSSCSEAERPPSGLDGRRRAAARSRFGRGRRRGCGRAGARVGSRGR